MTGGTPLHAASCRGHKDVVQILIDAGANAAARDSEGCTPLYEATRCGYVEVMKILLSTGCAEIEANSKCCPPALHIAASEGHVAGLQELLKNGADPNSRNYKGNTALHRCSNTEIARLLIDYNADIKMRNRKGLRPIDSARKSRRNDVERLLKSHGRT